MATTGTNALQEAWEDYRDRVVPKDPAAGQVTETRRAFYAGAWAVLCEVKRLGADEVTEDEGVAALAAMVEHGERFFEAVKAGRA